MTRSGPNAPGRAGPGTLGGRVLAGALVLFIGLPLVALVLASSPSDLWAGIEHPAFAPALALSARTSVVSLVLIMITGTPLAWWLATSRSRFVRPVELLVDLPIVIPPAVLGIALLEAYGRQGLLGSALAELGFGLPFSTSAVVVAQVVVSSPFYVQSVATAFRQQDRDLWSVARTLGASPANAFLRVALPVALPGIVSGAALAWARAIGEFGATLLFAGNRAGVTQTMPLAIYSALESDVRLATSLAVILGVLAVVALVGIRFGRRFWSGLRLEDEP